MSKVVFQNTLKFNGDAARADILALVQFSPDVSLVFCLPEVKSLGKLKATDRMKESEVRGQGWVSSAEALIFSSK